MGLGGLSVRPDCKRILTYFKTKAIDYRTLIFAPSSAVKQAFHITFGGKSEVWGQLPPAPAQNCPLRRQATFVVDVCRHTC